MNNGPAAERLPAARAELWEWQLSAHCRGVDSVTFFGPTDDQECDAASESAAKEICASCPVRKPCLAYAMEAGEPYGVWGGLTERERRRYRWALRPRPRRSI